MPAPEALHQAPRCGRRSTREALTQVSRTVEVLAAVGRAEPPQPLREVSMIMPIVDGKPADTRSGYMSAVKPCSSTSGAHWQKVAEMACVPFTVGVLVIKGSTSGVLFAVSVMKPSMLANLAVVA